MEENGLTVKEIISILKKRWAIIVLCTVLVTSLVSVIAFLKMKPTYEGSVKLFVGKTQDADKKYSKEDITTNSMMMSTYIELIRTEDFLNKVVNKSSVNVSPEGLLSGLKFENSKDTSIVQIRYTSSNSEIPIKVLTTISGEFEQRAKEIVPETYVKVIDSAKVSERDPNVVKTILIGFFLGLFLGVGIVLVSNALDDTISSKEELEKLIPIPVLGELPIVEKKIKKELTNKKIKLENKERKLRVV